MGATATNGAAAVGTKHSYVLLRVGNSRFALRSELVEELAPPVKLHKFPNTTPLVAGVIVRRGRIVPVYDVSRVLCGRESSVHRFYLVARRKFGKESEAGAIPVNGECELTNSELVPGGNADAAYFAGSLQVGEEEIKVLNLESLVSGAAALEIDGAQGEARP
jgi:chemotaxis signal transduction protein